MPASLPSLILNGLPGIKSCGTMPASLPAPELTVSFINSGCPIQLPLSPTITSTSLPVPLCAGMSSTTADLSPPAQGFAFCLIRNS